MPNHWETLEAVIRRQPSALVAFSGGADSALVLAATYRVLGDRTLGLTAVSPSLAEREREAALALAAQIGAPHLVVESREVEDPRYIANGTTRCYFCKSELYDICGRVARDRNFAVVFDGLNLDDLGEERPGRRAAREHGVVSPLVEAGLTKLEVRALSKSLGLPTWDKPASPCLSSRIPHGSPVTPEKLRQVEACENFLRDRGFSIVRVRHLGATAKVELGRDELARLTEPLLSEFESFAREVGFEQLWVAPEGYRLGGADVPLPIANQTTVESKLGQAKTLTLATN